MPLPGTTAKAMLSISAGNRDKPLEAANTAEVAPSLCEKKLYKSCVINVLLMCFVYNALCPEPSWDSVAHAGHSTDMGDQGKSVFKALHWAPEMFCEV